MTTPAPAPAPAADGKTLGIIGLVLAFVFAPAGIIVSVIAKNQSKAAGVENTPAKIGLILSIIFTIIWVIVVILNIVAFFALLSTGAVVTTY